MNGPNSTNSPDLIARSSASISAADIIAAVRRIEFDPDLESLHSGRRPAEVVPLGAAGTTGDAGPAAARFSLPVEFHELGVRAFESAPAPSSARRPASASLPARASRPATTPSLRIVSRRPKAAGPVAPSAPVVKPGPSARLDLDSPPDARELEAISRGAGSPRLAASLSLAIPGLGHFYAGEWPRALLLAIGFASAAFASYRSPWGAVGFAAGAVAAALWIFAAADAFAAVLRETPWGRPRAAARPRLAPLASTLVPGWGQFLNDEARKATLFLVALPVVAGAIALLPLSAGGPGTGRALTLALGCAGVVIWALSVYDAGLIASQRGRRRAARESHGGESAGEGAAA